MKTTLRWVAYLVVPLFLATSTAAIAQKAYAEKTRLSFSGGPDGGTFQYFSNGIATRVSKDRESLEISNMASAGSIENIRRVNAGESDFGVAYSGDTFLARSGKLPKDTRKYENVQAVAYLYGAPAHLIVLEGSGIDTVTDLVGKRIAVGGAGSGAAASAQRYFTALGLWDKMEVEFIGYSRAASALGDKLIDAMWVFSGFPNSSVIQAAATGKIKILSTYDSGKKTSLFKKYPFYTPVTIPAGTYIGVDYDVKTFQDSALWIVGKHVDPDIVYPCVKDIFSAEGLSYLVKVKSTARAMSIEGALTGVVIPVHEGAERFWKENGLVLTPEQLDR